jgi:hypothetical protein
MALHFIQLVLFLDFVIRIRPEEFDRAVPAILIDFVRFYAALIQHGSQMQSVTPAFSKMYRSLFSIDIFHMEYPLNRPALRRAMLECAVFQPFRAMLLPEEGWHALCYAINGLKQLGDQMPAVNPEVYFAQYSPLCINDFQLAVDELLEDGHEIDGIQHSLTECLNSLQNYNTFIVQYAANYAAIRSAVMNIQLPFVPVLAEPLPAL